MKHYYLLALSCLLPLIPSLSVSAQPKSSTDSLMSSATFSGLQLRSIGPAFTSGRVAAFAVDPNDRAHYFVAVASGGVWETKNDGTSWTPVFDNEGSYSIGAIAMDPKNPFVVWVGTGENNSQRSVGYGDGVYKTLDGGKSWTDVGLKKSEHIGRILIDPRNSNVVFVASQGPLWGPGGDRGVFKTTDGGRTWRNVLSISENTGVNDIEMDPTNPDLLYASSYQRRRHVWTLIDGGPESAIYKSTDGGESWRKISSGLPTVDMGKIGLAISPVKTSVVYAIVEAAEGQGGVFRSTDFGETWEKRNSFDQTAMYYSTIYADPSNVDRIYVMNFMIQVSNDGGKTLTPLNTKSKHVDNHAMWIDPRDPRYYLVGCDGGVYESYDRGATWDFKNNLPVTQFYDVTVDNSKPFYYIYGGTQDNNSMGGPSRTVSASGIVNSDWFITAGGDGFQSRVDPEDPNTVYSESQYGGLVRFERKTGQVLGIQPQQGEDEAPLRWQWDSPLIISPFSHTRLYFACNKLFRSDDRGDTWTEVSGDLTRQIDRNKLKVMGKIWNVDAVAKNASTTFYGTCTTISESPMKEGLLYVGTDDGLIEMTEDAGKTWRKIEKFPGVPEMTYVSRVYASQFDLNTVYATFDNHKNAEFTPYVLKSTDRGKSWTTISSDLPKNGPVLAFTEDYIDPNLLFVGTEFGLFFTSDGGNHWIQLKGDMPTIPVRDLVIQKREGDLIAASFGRGFYVLDDYSPLRSADERSLSQSVLLFHVKDAMLYIQSQPLGDSGKAAQGESFFAAPNPPFGATFAYYLKESLKTKKEIRQEKEKEAEKKGEEIPYPSQEELTSESMESQPVVELRVTDESGNVVRKIDGPSTAGMHRVNWDLTYPDMIASGGSDGSGPLVMPGKYSVTLFERIEGKMVQLSSPQTFAVYVEGADTMKHENHQALIAFQKKVASLNGEIRGAIETANLLKNRLGLITQALRQTPAAVDSLWIMELGIEKAADSILIALRGNETLRALSENTPVCISERVSTIMGNEATSTAKPPQTDINSFETASEEFILESGRLKELVEVRLKNLEEEMKASGSPWVPGTLPEWNGK
ncbi:MAG TPA: hypothetical protein VLX91_04345 [Candidatus Acidoferrales bacterium]|nr:hypothetical protein [Candidatus Acidoferrales bacterium]